MCVCASINWLIFLKAIIHDDISIKYFFEKIIAMVRKCNHGRVFKCLIRPRLMWWFSPFPSFSLLFLSLSLFLPNPQLPQNGTSVYTILENVRTHLTPLDNVLQQNRFTRSSECLKKRKKADLGEDEEISFEGFRIRKKKILWDVTLWLREWDHCVRVRKPIRMSFFLPPSPPL